MPRAAIGYDPHALAGARPQERHAVYRRMQEQGPIFVPDLGAWILTRYADVRQVLLDREHFTAAGSIGIDQFEAFPPAVRAVFDTGYERFPGIIEMDPPQHTRYRALVDAAFKPRRVAALEQAFRDIAHRLIDGFVGAGRTDLIAAFSIPYPMAVICHVIGIPDEDLAEVHRMSAGFATLEAGAIWRRTLEEQVASAEQFVAFQHYAAALVEERRAKPQDDLLSLLVGLTLDGHRAITLEEAISWVIHLLFAGHETNARSLGTTIHALLAEPHWWQAIVTDPSLIPNVVEEGLRLEPPVTYHSRTTVRAVTISGVEIPPGSIVHVVFAAANRDAAVFAEPAAFDPARSNISRHLGFGWGIHHCVGAPVARLESRTALEALTLRLPNLRLASRAAERERHPMLRGLEHLPVEWNASDGRPDTDRDWRTECL
jgi:cytochrome P450